MREGDSRNNCQIGGLHQIIIKVIGRGIMHHPYSLPMPMWNSSLGMHGYPSAPYFDPWYVSLCYGVLSNYFTYQWSRAKIFFLAMHIHVDEFIWPIF